MRRVNLWGIERFWRRGRWVLLAVLTAVLTAGLCWLAVPSSAVVPNPVVATRLVQVAATGQTATGQTATGQAATGQDLYEAGRYQEAVRVLQQTVEQARQRGDRLAQATALGNLSLSYQALGQLSEAEPAIAQALQLAQTPPPTRPEEIRVLAQLLMIQGRLQLSQGRSQPALESWQQATAQYARIEDINGQVNSQINQAQALQRLGFYPRALQLLKTVQAQLADRPDSAAKFVALVSLGDALRQTGELQESQQVLQQSLELAQRLQRPEAIARAHLSLGYTLRDLLADARARSASSDVDFADILSQYQQAADRAIPGSADQIQAQISQLNLLLSASDRELLSLMPSPARETGPRPVRFLGKELQTLVVQLQTQVKLQPPSRTAVYQQIELAETLVRFRQLAAQPDYFLQGKVLKSPTWREIAELLSNAVQKSQQLGDRQAESRALGSLGELYERAGNARDAQTLTQRALLLAETNNAADIAYRWQWQLGRLQVQQGDREGAIQSYETAIHTLQGLRGDLVSVGAQSQVSFRRSVEPVYRQFVSLLLQPDQNVSSEELDKARKTIEGLQIEELNNFFREACLTGREVQIDNIDTQAAVIYPIILDDNPLNNPSSASGSTSNRTRTAARLEVILSLPQPHTAEKQNSRHQNAEGQSSSGQEAPRPILLRHSVSFDLDQAANGHPVNQQSRRLFELLKNSSQNNIAFVDPNAPARQLYDWLIRPFERELQNRQIKTLVFVSDGALRKVPMSVLYDGQQFLIEKYAVALAPSLQLVESGTLTRDNPQILLGGVSAAQQTFPALPGVTRELEKIRTHFSESQVLLNEQLTTEQLETVLNETSFPIVHLATHGLVTSQVEDTFILTWQDKVQLNELRSLLQTADLRRRQPIELLVLSACETAEGDDQAALGLAGIALRARARSTMATLWRLRDDIAPELFDQFYQELRKPDVTRAEALRRAQRFLMQDPQKRRQPYLWSPVVLLGNWS